MVEYNGNSPLSSQCKCDVIILYQYPILIKKYNELDTF